MGGMGPVGGYAIAQRTLAMPLRHLISVAANIVEGSAKDHRRERLQFLKTSRASLAELGYCPHVAKRLGYLDDEQLPGSTWQSDGQPHRTAS
jgi:hypothetical protein